MDTLLTIVDFLVLGLIIAIPILLLHILKWSTIEHYSIYYFSIGLLLLGLAIYFFAWWTYEADMMRLEYYGYNIDGMNDEEFYGKVLPENMEKVKSIQISVMGIGWKLKAIFGFIAAIPYLLIVYIGYILLQLIKRIKRNHSSDKIIQKKLYLCKNN